MYKNKEYTNFCDDKMPEENEGYACFSVLLLDSLVKINKKYYPQILLEECKYTIKKKNIINANNEELSLNESDD